MENATPEEVLPRIWTIKYWYKALFTFRPCLRRESNYFLSFTEKSAPSASLGLYGADAVLFLKDYLYKQRY